MGEVLTLPNGTVLTKLSDEELRREWRETQNEMLVMEAEQLEIAEALWPEGDSERPAKLREEGITAARLIEGIASLHELTDRLYAENERLRARAHGVVLSGLDRADISGVLETYASMCEEHADSARCLGAETVEGTLRAKALRMRELIALLATLCLLVLAGCAEGLSPPPHDVYLVDVPEADLKVWDQAIGAWNDQVGLEVLVRRYDGPSGPGPHVFDRCGVYVFAKGSLDGDQAGATRSSDCVQTIRYERGRAWCTAGHELGHALGLEHRPDTVMAAEGCTFVLPSHLDGQDVKEMWGMP